MLTFRFTGTRGVMTESEVLTSGMVGKQMLLEFSTDWDGLVKTVVFSNGSDSLDVVYSGSPVTIPALVLEKPLRKLTVGIYGISPGGQLVIPTVRAEGPDILPGTKPSGERGKDPTLPVWAQLQALIGPLEELDTEARENLVQALNEVAAQKQEAGGQGENGITFTPSVSEEGILSWTNDGGLENPRPVNIKGPQGPRGAVGLPGLQGTPGADGKSAYAFALEGGYAGTETEFAAKLAVEVPSDAHIWGLINEALGVIENGSY